MVTHQSFSEWQQNPVQGAVSSASPLTPADQSFLEATLLECQIRLKMALEAAQTYRQLPDLATALGDAVTGCDEALAVLNDPSTYLDASDD